MSERKCCMCGKPLAVREFNSPWPLREQGKCCDICNISVVMPARMRLRYGARVAICSARKAPSLPSVSISKGDANG